MEQVQEKEGERKALEQAALAEFLASQGIQAAAAAPHAAPAAKEIGPASQQQAGSRGRPRSSGSSAPNCGTGGGRATWLMR